jgi:hypothetical protein
VDQRRLDYLRYLSWGWTPPEAAWSAYFGKPYAPAPVRPAWLYSAASANC